MTVAICYKCGEFKKYAFAPCPKCHTVPHTDEELMLSLVMSDHYFDRTILEQDSKAIKEGMVPAIDQETRKRLSNEIAEFRKKGTGIFNFQKRLAETLKKVPIQKTAEPEEKTSEPPKHRSQLAFIDFSKSNSEEPPEPSEVIEFTLVVQPEKELSDPIGWRRKNLGLPEINSLKEKESKDMQDEEYKVLSQIRLPLKENQKILTTFYKGTIESPSDVSVAEMLYHTVYHLIELTDIKTLNKIMDWRQSLHRCFKPSIAFARAMALEEVDPKHPTSLPRDVVKKAKKMFSSGNDLPEDYYHKLVQKLRHEVGRDFR